MFVAIKRFFTSLWDVLEVIIVALAAAFFIRYFIAQPFLVSGASMEPNFHNANFLIVDEISYRFRQPQRGEVIIFKYPGKEKEYAGSEREYFIKRIIGLPGETLTVVGNTVTITTTSSTITLNEPYIRPIGQGQELSRTLTLGPEEYFVMGDNRGSSFDSRSWGALQREDITGVARLRVFPFEEFGLIEHASYENPAILGPAN